MKKFACPSCGAEIKFISGASVFMVCSYCSSMVVRHDLDLEAIGKMAQLPEDMSVIQIGTGGIYQGVAFNVVGRLRLGWSDGFWNEWYVQYIDGKSGWLAEAQGFYMMSFETPDPGAVLPEVSQLKSGLGVRLKGQLFEVSDIKQATCVGSQGELPFRAPQGRKNVSVDLKGPSKGFATLDYSVDTPKPECKIYMGQYVEFDELKFNNLRQIDGW